MNRRWASARASRGQAGVIGEHGAAELLAEPDRELVALRARARVDDRRQRVRLLQDGGDAAMARLLRRARHDREREVRPVEPGGDARGIAEPEAGDDVVRHLGRRGRRRGDDRLGAEPARGVGEPEVVRPEVVPPLGDAVRLVDDEQARRAPGGSGRGSRARRSARARRRAGARARTPRGRAPRGSSAASCCALTIATLPGATRSSASTWSCISETSGETTIVRSARMSAGSW